MRSGIVIDLRSADRERLERIWKDRNTPQKHVWRAEIVLLSANGVGTSEIVRWTGTSKTCVWRGQERFMQEGGGRPAARQDPPVVHPCPTPEVVAWGVTRTHEEPPGETTYWTASLMAREAGISASSVHRIWRANGLQSHRVRQFKLSNDPEFIDKLRDVVGLYVAPPAHAIVLSFDEKSQIQALDRSQPGLPLNGREGPALYKAVLFEAAQRQRQHFMEDAIDRPLNGVETRRTFGQHRDNHHRPFFADCRTAGSVWPTRDSCHSRPQNGGVRSRPTCAVPVRPSDCPLTPELVLCRSGGCEWAIGSKPDDLEFVQAA